MCDGEDGSAAPRPELSQRPVDADDPDYGTLQRLAVHALHTFVDLYVAFVTFGLYLFTFETLVLCILSVGSVTFYSRWYSYAGELRSAATPGRSAFARGCGFSCTTAIARWADAGPAPAALHRRAPER
jgi:hypothetical protein